MELGVVLVTVVRSSEFNAATKEGLDMAGGGHNVGTLVGDVVLQASLLVDAELNTLIDGATKSLVVLASVNIIGVVLGVVDVVLWTVAAETVSSHLELLGAIAEGEETQDAEKETDGLGRNRLDRAHVDGLRVISEPVAKVDARHIELVELLASGGAGQGDGKKNILDVTVSP